MTAPYVISIHGVGIHPDGAIERHVEETLRRAKVEANVCEFNWDKVSPHFLDVDDGIGDFLRQASGCVFAATRLGFAPPHCYPLPAALRIVDRICSFVAVAASSLACTLALIFPFTAALYLVVFAVYAELSWADFAWAGRPATAVVVGLFAVALASALLAIVAAGLVAPIRGRWVLYLFLRRYVLLILSRDLVVVTVPLRFRFGRSSCVQCGDCLVRVNGLQSRARHAACDHSCRAWPTEAFVQLREVPCRAVARIREKRP